MKKHLLTMASVLLAGCVHKQWLVKSQDPLSASEHIQLARIYASQKQPAAAEEYQAALRSDPHNVEALLSLGDMAFEKNRLKEAEKYYTRALKVAPQNPRAMNNLAMVDWKKGRLEGAEKLARAATVQETVYQPYAWDTLANVYISQKKFTEAAEALHHAEASGPAGDPAFAQNLEKSKSRLNEESSKK